MNDNQFLTLVVDVGRILLDYIQNSNKDDYLFITYGDLAKKLPYEFNPRNLDRPLGALSDYCRDLGLPYISTIVVNQDTLMPGVGFYKEFFPATKESEQYKLAFEQNKLVRQCRDWTPLAAELGLE